MWWLEVSTHRVQAGRSMPFLAIVVEVDENCSATKNLAKRLALVVVTIPWVCQYLKDLYSRDQERRRSAEPHLGVALVGTYLPALETGRPFLFWHSQPPLIFSAASP
jgi:hypothetical protein